MDALGAKMCVHYAQKCVCEFCSKICAQYDQNYLCFDQK